MAEDAMTADAFADLVVSTIKRSLEQPQARIAALERRIRRARGAAVDENGPARIVPGRSIRKQAS